MAPSATAGSGGAPLAADGTPQTRDAVVKRLRAARYVLLGEVHDNAEQHRLRAGLLRDMLADARPTWVVFEQIDRQYTVAMQAAVQAAPRDVDTIVAAGRLDQKGWAWPLHRPLFEAALAGGAAIVGGNLARSELSPVVKQGQAGLPADVRGWFDGSMRRAEWSQAQTDLMLRLVDEGHCKALPPTMLAPMALAQRARDAALAQAMLQAPAGVRVVLIAGNGHVRRDVGVPRYLEATGVAANAILSVGFEELEPQGEKDAAAAAATGNSGDPRYDLLWRNAAVARPDPCEAFRAPRPQVGTHSGGPHEGSPAGRPTA